MSLRRINTVNFPPRRLAWLYAVILAEHRLWDTRSFGVHCCDSIAPAKVVPEPILSLGFPEYTYPTWSLSFIP